MKMQQFWFCFETLSKLCFMQQILNSLSDNFRTCEHVLTRGWQTYLQYFVPNGWKVTYNWSKLCWILHIFLWFILTFQFVQQDWLNIACLISYFIISNKGCLMWSPWIRGEIDNISAKIIIIDENGISWNIFKVCFAFNVSLKPLLK